MPKGIAVFGAPGGIRTPDLPVRSRTLYPTKLLVHILYYYNVYMYVFQVKYKKSLKKLLQNYKKYDIIYKRLENINNIEV